MSCGLLPWNAGPGMVYGNTMTLNFITLIFSKVSEKFYILATEEVICLWLFT